MSVRGTYPAFSHVAEVFSSFDEAVEHLRLQPGAEGKRPVAVGVYEGTTSNGAIGRVIDGEPEGIVASTQAYVVGVRHDLGDAAFLIEYLVEFKAEEIVDEPEDEFEPGQSEPSVPEGSDEGVESPGDGAGEAPPAGSEEPVSAE